MLMSFALSCSSSPVDPPISPTQTDLSITAGREVSRVRSDVYLWGIWDITIDTETNSVGIVPIRGVSHTWNVNDFVDGPPSNLAIEVSDIDVQPDYIDIPVIVSITHPFPSLSKVPGFDVIGVFMGNGTDTYPGQGGYAVAGENDPRLMNADGYTRWFNYPEFNEVENPLLGWNPGNLGNKTLNPSAQLNPYKYFAHGLWAIVDPFEFLVHNAEGRGAFLPGDLCQRAYDLRFPVGGVLFQYAIIAHWKGAGMPDPELDDFPPEANSDEAPTLGVDDNSTAWYIDGDFGGNIDLDISPWDWSATVSPGGIMDEYEIRCYSDAWTGAYEVDMSPVDGGVGYSTYNMDIAVETLDSSDPLPIWIEVTYPDLDYSNPFGIENNADGALTSYFLYNATIADQAPPSITVLTPNGGEEWRVGSTQEITWSSVNVDGDIQIRYSKDNFVSDFHTITPSTENNGSFMWEIPEDESETVRIRISAYDDPDLFDYSDDDFTIWKSMIELLTPNGGEMWEVGTDEEITWSSEWITGPILIEYSKDNFASDINVIAPDAPNTSTYVWENIPNDLTTTARVRITSVDDTDWFDVSDADFTIWKASLEITSPNGSEIYQTGCDYKIKWNSQYITDTLVIDYSTDDFVSVITEIATGVENTGEYLWEDVPFDISDTVKVRIRTEAGSYAEDTSDGDFSIVEESGRALTWGGTGIDSAAGITIDSGYTYIAGEFRSTVDFDPSEDMEERTSSGSSDAFLSVFDSCGALLLLNTWGGESAVDASAVAVDGLGNIYVSGTFEGTVDLDPGSGIDSHSASGANAVYIVSFDSAGAFRWGGSWGGQIDVAVNGIDVDSGNNVYVAGWFQDTIDFDPGTGTTNVSSAGYEDAYVSKFDSAGVFQWVKRWGNASVGDMVLGLDVTPTGDIYTVGQFLGGVDFDPGPGTATRGSTGTWLPDPYISKLNSSGDFQWVQAWGSEDYEFCNEVTAVDGGYVHAAGWFNTTADFDPGAGTNNLTSSGGADIFVSRFTSSDGAYHWTFAFGGPAFESVEGIASDGTDMLYLAGYFEETVDFDPGPGTVSVASNGGYDPFLAVFNLNELSWVRTWGGTGSDQANGLALTPGFDIHVVGLYRDDANFAPTGDPCFNEDDWHTSNGSADAFVNMFLSDGCW